MFQFVPTRVRAVYRPNVALKKDRRDKRITNSLSFKLAGKTVYTQGDRQVVSAPKTCVLLPKNASYEIDFAERGECCMIDFETADPLPTEVVSCKISAPAPLLELLSEMERILAYKRPGYEYEVMSKFYKLLHLMTVSEDTYFPGSKAAILRPALQYIEAHFADGETDNDTLAALSGVSTSYFRKLFVGLYSVSPAKYIQTLKLNRAKELLLAGEYSIAEIAERAGFGSVYYFDAAFRKETGLTPTAYVRSVLSSL